MNVIFWDLFLMGLFLAFVVSFLIRKRKKIKRDGLLYLYHTKWGINWIDKVGTKYKKTLKVLSYFSVWIGYILMAGMIYLFGRIVYIYAFHSDIVRAIKIPPIMPLIPYLPQMFKLNFLPPFYFTYWIIGLAIIAITHEFFHGIFAKLAKVETKTTGFGFFPFFFPVFLAAFVELNEEKMTKRKNFEQRAVLSAGTFANILTAILGVFIMWGLFAISFQPAGIVPDDYAYNIVPFEDVVSISGVPFEDLINSDWKEMTAENILTTDGTNYYGLKAIDINNELMAVYYDSPAINNEINKAIMEINGEKIINLDSLSKELEKYSPGEEISIKIYDGEEAVEKTINLGENPRSGGAWLGVSFQDPEARTFMQKFSSLTTAFREPNVYYEANSDLAQFIYDFFWWLVLISFSVALVNMLPMGIFDGGRFFYLTILAITKSEKKAENSFKYMTKFFLFLLLVVMFFWAKSFF